MNGTDFQVPKADDLSKMKSLLTSLLFFEMSTEALQLQRRFLTWLEIVQMEEAIPMPMLPSHTRPAEEQVSNEDIQCMGLCGLWIHLL